MMQSNSHLWQAAFVVVFGVLTSPAFAQEPSREPQAGERAGSPAQEQTETEADRALAERVRQSLQENAPLSGAAQNIRITVANGEVTLRGEVKTAEERDGIASQVCQIEGVHAVKNRLRLAGAEKLGAARTEDGTDGVRAAVEHVVRAENAHDLDAMLALAHDQVVFVGPFTAFPVEGKEAYRQVWQSFFANEQFTVTLTNPQVLTFGPTGVAWGLYTLMVKPKDGRLMTSAGRYTLTFTRTEGDGKWLLVAFHASRLPSERR
jgi:hyperosmotically inducible protein